LPKTVDHELRRVELAEAVWRVLTRAGMEGVTVRSVTAEAGWSRGAVEHYFTGKEAMVRYAYHLAAERGLAQVRRVRRRFAGREALRAVLQYGFAFTPDPNQATGIWCALLSGASHDQDLAAELVRFDEQVREVLAEIIREMQERGEVGTAVDPENEAHAIFAFNLGLVIGMRMQPEYFTGAVVEAEIEALLARLASAPGSTETVRRAPTATRGGRDTSTGSEATS
jgi:AcrR family transcriptional regulator